MFALVFNKMVVQISDKKFPVAPDLVWVDLGLNSNNVIAGHGYDGKSFIAPIAPTFPAQKEREANYPSLANLQEMLYNSMINGEMASSKAFITAMAAIQTKYPLTDNVTNIGQESINAIS